MESGMLSFSEIEFEKSFASFFLLQLQHIIADIRNIKAIVLRVSLKVCLVISFFNICILVWLKTQSIDFGLVNVTISSTNFDEDNQTLTNQECVIGALNRHFCQTSVEDALFHVMVLPFLQLKQLYFVHLVLSISLLFQTLRLVCQREKPCNLKRH